MEPEDAQLLEKLFGRVREGDTDALTDVTALLYPWLARDAQREFSSNEEASPEFVAWLVAAAFLKIVDMKEPPADWDGFFAFFRESMRSELQTWPFDVRGVRFFEARTALLASPPNNLSALRRALHEFGHFEFPDRSRALRAIRNEFMHRRVVRGRLPEGFDVATPALGPIVAGDTGGTVSPNTDNKMSDVLIECDAALTAETFADALKALADFYRACGGAGFRVVDPLLSVRQR